MTRDARACGRPRRPLMLILLIDQILYQNRSKSLTGAWPRGKASCLQAQSQALHIEESVWSASCFTGDTSGSSLLQRVGLISRRSRVRIMLSSVLFCRFCVNVSNGMSFESEKKKMHACMCALLLHESVSLALRQVLI